MTSLGESATNNRSTTHECQIRVSSGYHGVPFFFSSGQPSYVYPFITLFTLKRNKVRLTYIDKLNFFFFFKKKTEKY